MNELLDFNQNIHAGLVGNISAFQADAPGSIPGIQGYFKYVLNEIIYQETERDFLIVYKIFTSHVYDII